MALEAALERQTLDEIAQVRVIFGVEFWFEPTIVAGARKPGDRAQMGDGRRSLLGLALQSLARHLLDDGEEMGAPLTRRFSSHDRKASRKKSMSACWRPTSPSN